MRSRLTGPFVIEKTTLQFLRAFAVSALPKEACGVLVGQQQDEAYVLSVVPTTDRFNTRTSFTLRRRDIDAAARTLAPRQSVCGCFHSHPAGSAEPTPRDAAGAKADGDLWLIYAVRRRALGLFQWRDGAFQRLSLTPASS